MGVKGWMLFGFHYIRQTADHHQVATWTVTSYLYRIER